MSDNIPKLDAIYDDLTHLNVECQNLRDTYKEELQTLTENLKLISKSDRKDIVRANEILQKRSGRVKEIITDINNMLEEIKVNLIVINAKKFELDEMESNADNQFAICRNELTRIRTEYLDIIKNEY